MPRTTPQPTAKFISVADAAERAGMTRQGIIYLINQHAEGPFPGACQLTDQPNSPYLIPLDEFEAWLKARERQ